MNVIILILKKYLCIYVNLKYNIFCKVDYQAILFIKVHIAGNLCENFHFIYTAYKNKFIKIQAQVLSRVIPLHEYHPTSHQKDMFADLLDRAPVGRAELAGSRHL